MRKVCVTIPAITANAFEESEEALYEQQDAVQQEVIYRVLTDPRFAGCDMATPFGENFVHHVVITHSFKKDDIAHELDLNHRHWRVSYFWENRKTGEYSTACHSVMDSTREVIRECFALDGGELSVMLA